MNFTRIEDQLTQIQMYPYSSIQNNLFIKLNMNSKFFPVPCNFKLSSFKCKQRSIKNICVPLKFGQRATSGTRAINLAPLGHLPSSSPETNFIINNICVPLKFGQRATSGTRAINSPPLGFDVEIRGLRHLTPYLNNKDSSNFHKPQEKPQKVRKKLEFLRNTSFRQNPFFYTVVTQKLINLNTYLKFLPIVYIGVRFMRVHVKKKIKNRWSQLFSESLKLKCLRNMSKPRKFANDFVKKFNTKFSIKFPSNNYKENTIFIIGKSVMSILLKLQPVTKIGIFFT
ncbi:hypothetical protein AGLY_017965 [Aphis glycines]|uniref:Uncharacterized protein n=1 Tax=Aphis glycines TaxID=307491 RepID=A0A6G0STN4_APHGL|nr:hypothetical protein AGLY_017965 [Aphis glycines]